MCRYIGDSDRTTPTKSSVELTGSVKTDVSKNIYDLAGNCSEWLMQAINTSNRIAKSGSFSGSVPISNRDTGYPTRADVYIVFRLALYINY